MNNPLFGKFLSLGVALIVNGMMIGGVAYLFSGKIHQDAPLTAVAYAPQQVIDRATV